MRVLILTTSDGGSHGVGRTAYDKILASAASDRFGEHQLVNTPTHADIILFAEYFQVDPLMQQIQKHPYVQQYRNKCIVYNTGQMLPILPLISPAIERAWYDPQRMRGSQYISTERNGFDSYAPFTNSSIDQDLLFSFLGNEHTHPIRTQIINLMHPRGHCEASIGSNGQIWYQDRKDANYYYFRFIDIARRSKFMLCPRGDAPSSFRLFEAMQFGRTPVIIADAWVAPEGPDWAACSLQIAERDIAAIPDILAAHEHQSESMGRSARMEWERWFSDQVTFHRLINWCADIQSAGRIPETWNPARVIVPLRWHYAVKAKQRLRSVVHRVWRQLRA